MPRGIQVVKGNKLMGKPALNSVLFWSLIFPPSLTLDEFKKEILVSRCLRKN